MVLYKRIKIGKMINEELVKNKYQEMKSQNKTEDFLDEKIFGEVRIFINLKPKMVLFFLQIEPDTVYVGSN